MSLIFSLLFAAFGFSIDKAQFNVVLPVNQNMQEKKALSYFEGVKVSKQDNKPLILFVNTEPVEVEGFVVCYEKTFEYQNIKKGFIITWLVDGKGFGDVNELEFSEELLYNRLVLRNLTVPEKLKAKFQYRMQSIQNFTQNVLNCTPLG